MVKLKINGREIAAAPGSSLLDAAQANGIRIPNLCASPSLSPYGGCRLCLVEIKGKRGYPPACSTVVEEGLEVATETPRLQALRRQTLELILSEHPHACLICSEKKDCEEYKSTIRKVGEVTGCVLCAENGRCELQDLVKELKIERVRWPAAYRDFQVHREDPFFDRNYNLCILCARCVRVCSEVRGAAAISIVYRGPQAVVGTSLDRALFDSGCQFCGACVDVCPTGSLGERGSRGEGLPDDSRETICPLCSLGCALEVGLKAGRIISSRPKKNALVNHGQACVKGRFIVRDTVHAQKRIHQPMVRRNGELIAVGWDEALEFAGRKLKKDREQDAAMVVSSQLALEDLFIARKFANEVLFVDPGIDFPRLSVPSFFRAELQKEGICFPLNFESASLSEAGLILIAGADIGHSQPILWLEVHKALRRGAKLLVWDSATPASERWGTKALRADSGSGLTVLVELCRRLFEERPSEKWSDIPGAEMLKTSLEEVGRKKSPSSPGMDTEEFQSAVRLLKETGPAVFLVGPGFIQEPDAPRLVRMLWNLALLCGARIIPLAEENNERGVIELWPSFFSEGSFKTQILDGLEKERFRGLYLAGDLPGLERGKASDFLIVQGCYQGAAAELADVFLPAVTWSEADGTFVNIEGRIQKFSGLIDPLGESRPDWWIFCRLAEKMGNGNFPYQSQTEITEEISRAVPSLHEVSAHHLKKGRSAFVVESKGNKSSPHFIPFASEEVDSGECGKTPESARIPPVLDYYRGLNLREEVKGLKKLRERDEARDHKEEK